MKKQKEKINITGILLLFLIFFIVADIVLLLMLNFSDKVKSGKSGTEITTESLKALQKTELQKYLETCDNDAIKNKIAGLKELLKSEYPGGMIDLDMSVTTDQYVSLILSVKKKDIIQAYSSFFYDLSNDGFKDNTLFDDDFLMICGRVLRKAIGSMDNMYTITNDRNTYTSFSINNDEVCFKFADLEQSIVIPLKRAYDGEVFVASDIDLTRGDTSRVLDYSKPMVALTYDDGPYATAEIAKDYYKYDSAATFYVVGNRLSDYPENMTQAIMYGMEIGSHSYSHANLVTLGWSQLQTEMVKTNSLCKELYGYEIKTFRPPYGSYNSNVQENIGMPMILWSIDTKDWSTGDKDATISAIMDSVQDGDVILLHETHSSSIDAEKEFIPMLIDEGYQLVTVSEMLESRYDSIENGHAYGRMIKSE